MREKVAVLVTFRKEQFRPEGCNWEQSMLEPRRTRRLVWPYAVHHNTSELFPGNQVFPRRRKRDLCHREPVRSLMKGAVRRSVTQQHTAIFKWAWQVGFTATSNRNGSV